MYPNIPLIPLFILYYSFISTSPSHGKTLNSLHNYTINGVLISSQEGDIYVEMGVPSMATCSMLILYAP